MILLRRDNAYCLHSKHIASGILFLTFTLILLRLITLSHKKPDLSFDKSGFLNDVCLSAKDVARANDDGFAL